MEITFRFLGFPIRVTLFFLLTTVLIGPREVRSAPGLAVAWIVVVFIGVFCHELGHALTARAFGQAPVITFQAFGGLTSWTPQGDVGAGKRLLISAAGPSVGIAVGFALLVLRVLATEQGTVPNTVLRYAVWVNLGWGIFNLFPMLPLDGGNIMASVFELVFPGRGIRAARVVSIVVATGVGVIAAVGGAPIATVLCVFLVYVNVQGLRGEGQSLPASGQESQPPPEGGEGGKPGGDAGGPPSQRG